MNWKVARVTVEFVPADPPLHEDVSHHRKVASYTAGGPDAGWDVAQTPELRLYTRDLLLLMTISHAVKDHQP